MPADAAKAYDAVVMTKSGGLDIAKRDGRRQVIQPHVPSSPSWSGRNSTPPPSKPRGGLAALAGRGASRPMNQRADPPNPRVVLGPVKAWPGNAGARGKASATANLAGPCARRASPPAGRHKGTVARLPNRQANIPSRPICYDRAISLAWPGPTRQKRRRQSGPSVGACPDCSKTIHKFARRTCCWVRLRPGLAIDPDPPTPVTLSASRIACGTAPQTAANLAR
jgi:hypothetical protein